MTALYTVLKPPTRVTEDEANFVNSYRRANRITVSETLRRCIKSLRDNSQDFKRTPYGLSNKSVTAFLVDADTDKFIKDIAYEKDISECQVVRSAIDCMSKKVTNGN